MARHFSECWVCRRTLVVWILPVARDATGRALIVGTSSQPSVHLEHASKPEAGPVQLRLCAANRTSEHRGNPPMAVTLDIVEDEDTSRTGRETGNCSLNPQPVNGSQELRIPIHNRLASRFAGLGSVAQGLHRQPVFAKIHNRRIDCYRVQPRIKLGLATEGVDLPKDLHEDTLRKFLCDRIVSHYAVADRIHTLHRKREWHLEVSNGRGY